MERICLFPGTFDPITLGHTDIIRRITHLFDKIVVGLGINLNKKPLYPLQQRMYWLKAIYVNELRVEVRAYDGLTIHFCKEVKAKFIVRGVRNNVDFELERMIADANRTLDQEIETIFIPSLPQFSTFSSTVVRDILLNGGDPEFFLPELVYKDIKINKGG